ncbi:MAG: YidC/Oxa1 family rane protein insertase [Cryptosporangiaceae bacterium]|nr:YidC/Oxa1 family rane protein insertase [Cryptosporangiaceae bacterium]
MFSTFALLAEQLINLVSHAVSPVLGPQSVAAGIVLATIAVRLALVPAGWARHRASRRSAELAGLAAGIRERYAGQRAKLTAELGALYQSRTGSVLAGFLPILLQIPLVAGMYQAVVLPVVHGHASLVAHHSLFGAALGGHLLTLGAAQLPVFVALLALILMVGVVSSRVLRPSGPRPTGIVGLASRIAPYAPAATALFLPVAGLLYLATTTAWTVAETAILRAVA